MERTVRSGINARKWLKKKKGPEFGDELRLHKAERSRRGDTITSLHRMIFEMAAYQLKINVDLVAEGYMDSEDHVAVFRSFCAVNGKFHIFFAYGAFAELPLTSGRYETLENWRQRTRIERVTMSNEDPTDLTAKCALIYRVDNTEKITLKNYQDLTYQRSFEALKPGETLITRFTADLQGFVESNAFEIVQANIDASMPEEEAACLPKTSVNDQFMRCVEDLRMVDQRIRERPLLEIDQKLFEGFLIRDVVIAETSKNPEKVQEIEKIFLKWMVQIRRILTESHQIYREIPSVGPFSEMLHWKNVLLQYTFVEAAIDTREFQSVLHCLTLAQSRLLKEWKKIKEDLNNSLIETRDINIFLESLGKYFDDLHKKSPGEVINQFPGLLKIIRSVSENSQHYQSPRKICEFVGAFITQMVILCRRHIEEDSSVWSQERSKLIERIETARNFLNTLEEKYKLIPDWECSIQHNFMEKKLLMERLMMVEKIFNIMDSFSVLDRIVMTSMEDFGRKMKENFAELASNPLSPLDSKNKSFSEDFGRFMRQTAAVEREVAEMMTNLVENCQTAAAMLLIVNQFRKFNLNCLCIENQYVTVARKLNKEAQRVYNNYMFMFAMKQSAQDSEQMSASEGIYLLRGLLRSIEDPINEVLSFNSVRVNQEIFEGLHCLDWIRPIFAKKERKLYKRWFIEMSTTVAKALKEPVFKRDFANNSGYAVNFKEVINQAIHESDKMQKIDLKLPAVGEMLLASKETLLQHRDALLLCAKKDRQLRRSIPQIFLELMTPWLRRVDRLFKEGQTLVCWQSSTLPTFIESLNGVLDETKNFVKQICDFSLIVEEHLAEISTEILLTVPQAPIPIEEFKQLNFNHFQEVVKTFLAKSAYIEKIVIGMIEKFCNGVDFPLNDDAERPQFQQSSANYGEEDSSLPINKYDWIDFANLPRRVDLPAMEEEVLWSDFDAVNFNLQYFHKNCMDVFNFFYDQFLSKLGNVFLNTLDFLAYQMSKRHEKDTGIVPIIAIKLNLKKFRFTIEPSLEAIRDHMGAIFKGLQGFFMKIPSWGFQAKIKERQAMKAGSWEKIYPKNVYSFILERVDMTKSLESFEINPGKELGRILEEFKRDYGYLWEVNRDEINRQIVDSEPSLIELREILEDLSNEIRVAEERKNADFDMIPLRISVRVVMEEILKLLKLWREDLCVDLLQKLRRKVARRTKVVNKYGKILRAPVKSIDDMKKIFVYLETVSDDRMETDELHSEATEMLYLLIKHIDTVPETYMDEVYDMGVKNRELMNLEGAMRVKLQELFEPFLEDLQRNMENFCAEWEKFEEEYANAGPLVPGITAKMATDRFFIFSMRFDEIFGLYEANQSGQKLFNVPIVEIEEIHERKKQLDSLRRLYGLYRDTLNLEKKYRATNWFILNVMQMMEDFKEIQNKFTKLPASLHQWEAYGELKGILSGLNEIFPLLELLRNPAIMEHHWDNLSKCLAVQLYPDSPEFTLGSILDTPILEFRDEVEDICIAALKEKEIDEKLRQIDETWSSMKFPVLPFKDRGNFLLKGMETQDLLIQLDDTLLILNSLAANRYNVVFMNRTLHWVDLLSKTSTNLDMWLQVQNLWLYLEAVFVSRDISRQLPLEAKRFANVDMNFSRIVLRAFSIDRLIECCTHHDLQTSFPIIMEELEKCLKSLSSYLERKRKLFPRFYFVSDAILIEILGRASNPKAIQAHLLSLFDGIARVEFSEDGQERIEAFLSNNGERVPLASPVSCTESIEAWLGDLLREMQTTIRIIGSDMAKEVVENRAFDFVREFSQYTAQMGIIGLQILWTYGMERAMMKSKRDSATVSRLGMVYFGSSVLEWMNILSSWEAKNSKNVVKAAKLCFDRGFRELLELITTELSPKMQITRNAYAKQCTEILDTLLSNHKNPPDEETVQRMTIYSMIWSLGAVLDGNDRRIFEKFTRSNLAELPWPQTEGKQSIFDFFINKTGNWDYWGSNIPAYEVPLDEEFRFTRMIIPNVESLQMTYLIKLLWKAKKPVLLLGEQGTGKTTTVEKFMARLSAEENLSKTLNFSYLTTPKMFQGIIEGSVDKRTGAIYGPPGHKKLTLFIDDLNIPMINEWGDQTTNEIVRQLIEFDGFYSLTKPGTFTKIEDLQFLAAMINPGGGQNDIPNRLKRQFAILTSILPSKESTDRIFREIAQKYFLPGIFSTEIVDFIPTLVTMTRKLWQIAKDNLLPSPAKFHYIFNLRGISGIWQGILQIQPEQCRTIPEIIKLWLHETRRIVSDRCVDEEDRQWFKEAQQKISEEFLEDSPQLPDVNEEIFFANFLQDVPVPDEEESLSESVEAVKVYESVRIEECMRKVQDFLDDFNATIRGDKLNLVLFQEALEHLIIISRIINIERGNALLIGLLAGYNTGNLLEDIKTAYTAAGLGKGVVFLFREADVVDETFLDHVNNLLMSGEIPNLFTKEDYFDILNELSMQTSAKTNFHLVLSFSPIGTNLRGWAIKFPGLLSGCTIDWFQEWPESARLVVARRILDDLDMVCEAEVKERLIRSVSDVHGSIEDVAEEYFERFRRKNYVMPKKFCTFLENYRDFYVKKKEEIEKMSQRMSGGIQKLLDAADSIEILKVELLEKEKHIGQATEEATKALKHVEESTQVAEEVRNRVMKKMTDAEELVREIEKDKAVVEQKLEEARPALEEAAKALLKIKASDLATVRKLTIPPHLVKVIMDCVLIYLNGKMERVSVDKEKNFINTSYKMSMKIMSGTKFLPRLRDFKTDRINDETMDLLVPYFRYPNYNFASAKLACGNVAGLLQWTQAMVKYYGINKDVLPLKDALKIEEVKREVAQKDLEEAQEMLREKEEELAVLQEELNKQQPGRKLSWPKRGSVVFLPGLGDEKVRWSERIEQCASEIQMLIGDVFYMSAFLTYSGVFNEEFRRKITKLLSQKLTEYKLPCQEEQKLEEFFIDPSVGVEWIEAMEKKNDLLVLQQNMKGFQMHVEDAIEAGRVVLLKDVEEKLDPCLTNVLEKNLLKSGTMFKVSIAGKEVTWNDNFRLYVATKMENPHYSPEISTMVNIVDFKVTLTGLENQLLSRVIRYEKAELEQERIGLVEDITSNMQMMEKLERDLLRKLSSIEGSILDDVDLLTMLNHSKTTSIDIREKLRSSAETQKEINKVREEYRPIAKRGSILYALLSTLPKVSHMYRISLAQFLLKVDESLAEASEWGGLEKRIASIIQKLTFNVFTYQSRGLYEEHRYTFILLMAMQIDLQLEAINQAEYDFLLKGGSSVDASSVPKKPFSWIPHDIWLNVVELTKLKRFSALVDSMQEKEKLWRAWYEKSSPENALNPFEKVSGRNFSQFHRLLLIRAFCPDRILSQSYKYIAESLGKEFLQPVMVNFSQLVKESSPLTPLICLLSMGSDPSAEIADLAKKEEIPLQSISMGQGQEELARKLYEGVMRNEGGWLLIQNSHLALEYMAELAQDQLVKESSPLTPLICLLSMGSDPSAEIADLAKKEEIPLQSISMGQGQEELARKLYEGVMRNEGGWLLIQNSHLALEYMAELAPELIWITSAPVEQYPIILLQMSIKYTNEPPSGIKAGLKRTYANLTQDVLDYSNSKFYIPLIYAISFLHTIIQERRKYGPIGWNIPYEFNTADRLSSCLFVQNHLYETQMRKSAIDWTAIRYMLSEVHYGGRVTDDMDKRLLTEFTEMWFNSALAGDDFEFREGFPMVRLKTKELYVKYFNEMDVDEGPEMCGLHQNVEINHNVMIIEGILDTIIAVQPKEATSGKDGETIEVQVTRQVEELLKKLPEPFDALKVEAKLTEMGTLNPMAIFLRQEVNAMQSLLAVVRKNLRDLLLAIDGMIVMSPALQDSMDSLHNGMIPKVWERSSWPTTDKLGFWFANLLQRVEFLNSWIFDGRPNLFWFGGLFNPNGFLTAIRQEGVKQHADWPLDTVKLDNEVLTMMPADCKKAVREGVLMHGLVLEGAGWDRKNSALCELQPKVVHTLMPVFHVFAVSGKVVNTYETYECPVYRTGKRKECVTTFKLRTIKRPRDAKDA
uniref:Dyneins heavy chain n=1 Tax=Lutzomyia longipalpis TaxID=7200 RepID=A0A1B0CTB8_LUTLO